MRERRQNKLLVQKFGGTSVATPRQISKLAERVVRQKRAGFDIIVVVSAMHRETDRLLALCAALAPEGLQRERDVVAASGEQVTVGLMAMALQLQGARARSFLSHQAGILTDSNFSDARILNVERRHLQASLDRGEIPVVAGFQGMASDGSLTTLGRGGSDTSAVALASVMNAQCCEIFKDVEGVYTTDPQVCESAKKLPRLSYSQMLELTSLGAKVLHPRSVSLAQQHGVPLHVRSSFSEAPGTQIDDEEDALSTFALTSQSRQISRVNVSVITARLSSQIEMEKRMRSILATCQIPVFESVHSNLSTTCMIPPQAQLAALRALHAGLETT